MRQPFIILERKIFNEMGRIKQEGKPKIIIIIMIIITIIIIIIMINNK